MKGVLLFIVALIGAAAFAFPRYFSAEARHRRAASELVTLVRMDEFAREGMLTAYRIETDKGKVSDSTLACLEKTDKSEFNDVLALRLTRDFSRYEIDSANGFYRSTTGERYVRMILTEIGRRTDMHVASDGPEPTVDIDDILKLDQFVKSYKSMGRHEPMWLLVDYMLDESMIELEHKLRDRCMASKT